MASRREAVLRAQCDDLQVKLAAEEVQWMTFATKSQELETLVQVLVNQAKGLTALLFFLL